MAHRLVKPIRVLGAGTVFAAALSLLPAGCGGGVDGSPIPPPVTPEPPEVRGAVWDSYLGGGPVDPSDVEELARLFNLALEEGRRAELDRALVRLVSETPPLPAPTEAPEARLASEVANTLGAYEWPETHPWAATFPGLPDRDARRGNGSVVVDATWREFPADAWRRERDLPLGFYAPPGEVVTISVPPSLATGELLIAAGQVYDRLRVRDFPTWRRPPSLRRIFPVTAAETAVTNAYGGALSFVVPWTYEGAEIPVTVEGAIPMAVYTAGRSSPSEWRADLNAGAPQAIIQKLGGIRFLISAENARSIDDPGEVSAFWDGFQQSHADLSGEPVPRAFESIWLFDPHVQDGYANAGWQRIVYPPHAAVWALLPGTAVGREYIATLPELGPQPFYTPPPADYWPPRDGVDWWLFGHELGHQWQNDDWSAPGVIEVQVNLFTMYTLNYYLYDGDDFGTEFELPTHTCAAPLDHAVLAGLRWSSVGDCEKLAMYRQLISEFGWDPIRRVFHSYYDPAFPRSTYGGRRTASPSGSATWSSATSCASSGSGSIHSRSPPQPPYGDSASRSGYRRAGRRDGPSVAAPGRLPARLAGHCLLRCSSSHS